MNTAVESFDNDKRMEYLNNSLSSILTSETLYGTDTQTSTKATVTSFLRGSPVKDFPLQENNLEPMTPATSGLKHLKSFAKLDPATRSWKMSEDSSRQATSKKSSKTWQKAGMMQDGECYLLPKWERRIVATDSGFWPTPTVNMVSGGPNHNSPSVVEGKHGLNLAGAAQVWPTPKSEGNRNSRNALVDKVGNGTHKSSLALEQAVEVTMGILPRELLSTNELPPKYQTIWPTPQATEARQGLQIRRPGKKGTQESLTTTVHKSLWPTPTVQDSNPRTGGDLYITETNTVRAKLPDGRSSNRGLEDTVKFATPQARDYRSGDTSRWEDAKKGYRSSNLNDQLGGKLNPAFVEWLMGFPIGWTSLDPLALERFNEWFGNATWWHAEFEDVPRLTQGQPNRVSRLKALGNGQVSLCMAVAWELLTGKVNNEEVQITNENIAQLSSLITSMAEDAWGEWNDE